MPSLVGSEMCIRDSPYALQWSSKYSSTRFVTNSALCYFLLLRLEITARKELHLLFYAHVGYPRCSSGGLPESSLPSTTLSAPCAEATVANVIVGAL